MTKKLKNNEYKSKYSHSRIHAKDTKGSLIKLLHVLKDYKGIVAGGMIISVLGQVLSLVVPLLLINLTKEIFDGKDITTSALFVAALLLLGIVLQYLQGYIFSLVSARISQNLRSRITKKINNLPLGYFDTTSYGDIMSRLTNDVDLVGRVLENTLSSIVTTITSLIAIPIFMFVISWQLTLIALCEIPICIVILIVIVKFNQKYFVKQQKFIGEMNGHIEEIYSAHNVVKAFNAEDKTFEEFSQINTSLRKAGQKAQFYSSLIPPLVNFVGNLVYISICLCGAYIAISSNNVTFAASIAGIMTYIKMFNQPLSSLGTISSSLQQTAAASERVFEFLSEKEQEDESQKNMTLSQIKGKVEFKHVSFGYTPEREIIHDFNFVAKPGQKIAIVGPTGAGKTTLVNLLMRFYEVSDGQILIDGVPINEMNRSYVRSLFGMVLQDTWLFEGTIEENLTYGNKDATHEQVVNACKMANIDHFIRTQTGGYDMILNEDSSISAGQKQLLTIARAMVQNAPMLIFDEATSSVDTRTEVLIQSAMDRLTKGRTSFVIAHRLSTIKNADQIIVMKDGAIVEVGKHKQLLAEKGFYAELYYSQFEREVEEEKA